MSPDDIKALRKELSCTARELATALGVEQESVMAWERGELFPTKRFVVKMEDLRRAGAAAIPRRKKSPSGASPMHALASPDIWRLFRKVLAHPELQRAALKLAEDYVDPADEALELK